MDKNEIITRVNAIFQDVFDDDSIVIEPTTSAKDIIGWDSLTHITLVGAIEDEFDIRFDMNEVPHMQNVSEMIDAIDHLVNN